MDKIEQIARVCHDANRGIQSLTEEEVSPPWDEAPQWQRDSAVDGVQYHLNGGVVNPRDSHRNWLLYKEADGWTYGPVKDADKREHPCMVPYEDLPPLQRVKDSVFAAIVKAMGEEL